MASALFEVLASVNDLPRAQDGADAHGKRSRGDFLREIFPEKSGVISTRVFVNRYHSGHRSERTAGFHKGNMSVFPDTQDHQIQTAHVYGFGLSYSCAARSKSSA